jgi:hypothetical protein
MGFIDYFLKSEVGLTPFRYFLKGLCCIKQPNTFDYEIFELVGNLFMELCEKGRNCTEGANLSKTALVFDELINNVKHFAESNEELRNKINQNMSFINKI